MEVNANKSTHFLPLDKIPSTFVQLAKREKERETQVSAQREREKKKEKENEEQVQFKSVVESPLSGQ